MTLSGVDDSENQDLALPWVPWFVGGGRRIAVHRASIGFRDDTHFNRYVSDSNAAGYIIGAYHAILGHQYYDPVRQAAEFLELIPPQVDFLVLDDEAPGVSDQDVLTWTIHVRMHTTLPLVLYGNWNLAAHIAAQPTLLRYRIWWAGYPTFPLPTTEPPWAFPKNVPAALIPNVIAWQYAGDNGRLPPYTKPIDLSVWYAIPGDGTVPPPPDDDDDIALKAAIHVHTAAIDGLL